MKLSREEDDLLISLAFRKDNQLFDWTDNWYNCLPGNRIFCYVCQNDILSYWERTEMPFMEVCQKICDHGIVHLKESNLLAFL